MLKQVLSLSVYCSELNLSRSDNEKIAKTFALSTSIPLSSPAKNEQKRMINVAFASRQVLLKNCPRFF